MFCSGVTMVKAARKGRRCAWCAEMIEVGQPYEHWTTIDDGPYRNAMHPECRTAFEDLIKLEGGGFVEYEPHAYARGSLEERR